MVLYQDILRNVQVRFTSSWRLGLTLQVKNDFKKSLKAVKIFLWRGTWPPFTNTGVTI